MNCSPGAAVVVGAAGVAASSSVSVLSVPVALTAWPVGNNNIRLNHYLYVYGIFDNTSSDHM